MPSFQAHLNHIQYIYIYIHTHCFALFHIDSYCIILYCVVLQIYCMYVCMYVMKCNVMYVCMYVYVRYYILFWYFSTLNKFTFIVYHWNLLHITFYNYQIHITYIYTYIYMYMYTCMHIYIHANIYIYVYIHICIIQPMDIYRCMYMCICTHPSGFHLPTPQVDWEKLGFHRPVEAPAGRPTKTIAGWIILMGF
jgi:hypothetical protein